MSAVFSPCGTWRYRLDRDLGRPGPVVCILGVNPSTAGEEVNDPTIKKDIGFGARLGWGWLIKGNLFAFKATDVRELRNLAPAYARGPDNDAHLTRMIQGAAIVIAAWGPTAKLPPTLRREWHRVAGLADTLGKPLWCFGVAQDGQPRHTLMIGYDTPLVPWREP